MVSNHISGTLTPEAKASILEAFDEILALLPFSVDLTTEERKRLSKMGDSSWAFVERAHNLVLRNPDFMPRSFRTDEMTRDVTLFREMHSLMQAATQLYERIEDTYKAAGADAFSAALAVYSYAKMSDPGMAMDDVLKEMGQRFSRRSKVDDILGDGGMDGELRDQGEDPGEPGDE